MDSARDTGILALVLVVLACLTVYFLGIGQPTGTVIDFFFPQL